MSTLKLSEWKEWGKTQYAFTAELVRRAASGVTKANLRDDASFGPQFGSEFDFSMLFSNAFFAILPAAIIISACLVYIMWYRDALAVTSKKRLFGAKTFFVLGLLACELARTAIWLLGQDHGDLVLASTSVAAGVLSAVSAAAVGVTVYYDHYYSPQSTIFLSIFLSISPVLDISRARSFFLRDMETVAGLSVGCAVTKFAVMFLLEIPKTLDSIEFKDKRIVPDNRAGFWGRVLLPWIGPFFFHGARNRISMDDLAALGPRSSSKHLSSQFEKIWAKADKTDKLVLLKTCLQSSLALTLGAWLACLIVEITYFLNVFAMQATLNVFRDENATREAKYGLIAANVLIFSTKAVADAVYLYATNKLSVHIRGTLIGEMFKKHTRISMKQGQNAALLSLITVEIDGIIDAIPEMYAATLVIPELAFALYFIYTIAGVIFFIPLVPITISTAIGHYWGIKTLPAMKTWNQSIQTRVAQTSVVLGRITGVKMMGLEQVVIRYLESLRAKEVEDSMAARRIRFVINLAMPLNYWFTPASIFIGGVYWTIWKDGLDTVTPWVVLNFISLVRTPMWYMLRSWGICSTLFACFGRIQDFLLLPEREDQREIQDSDYGVSPASESEEEKLASAAATEKRMTLETEQGKCCINLNKLSVASDEPGEMILQDLTVSMPASKLTMVVGPVGSGKTVLLKTLLGEMPFCNGSIQISTDHMAYCDQRTWLRDGSIQDAILGYEDLHKARYSAVIDACALMPDINVLGGHDSRIGTNGAKLSGGQRQRVALARALYSSCPILLCDDVLSALDFKTATHVFDAVFGPEGMLKREERSVVFAAHERAWLTSADQVLYLNNKGQGIVYKGKDAVEGFLHTDGCLIATRDGSHESSEASDSELESAAANHELEFAREENRNPAGKLDFSLYRYLLRGLPEWEVVTYLLFTAIHGFMERAPDLFLSLWIARAPTNKELVWLLLSLGAIAFITRGGSAWIFHIRMVPKIALKTHSTFANAVLTATLPYLTSTSNGVMLNRFSQDMTLLGQSMPQALNTALHVFSVYLTVVGFIVAGTDYSAITLPALFGLMWFIQHFYLRTSRQMRLLDLEAKTPLFNLVNDMVSGLEHIRGLQWEDQMIAQGLSLLDDSQKAVYYMITIQRWLSLVLDIVGVAMATILVSVALLKQGATSAPVLGMSLLNMTSFGILSREVILTWTRLETSLGSITRLMDFASNTPQEKDRPDAEDPDDSWPSQARVEFIGLTAKYGPEPSAPLALDNVNITFEPGQKALLTGRTGSGKSTMVLSILNLLDLEGQILIDDIDITKVPRQKLRGRFTTLPQDSIEISGTVLNNLLPFNIFDKGDKTEVTDDIIKTVLQDVCLWDHIESKGGLHTSFQEVSLSAGQKQLLHIASAILHHMQFKTKIVLMDEVTSSMDHHTREKVNLAMERAFRKCTWIVVSHQQRDLTQCDVVLTLSNSRLVGVSRVNYAGSAAARLGEPTKARNGPRRSSESQRSQLSQTSQRRSGSMRRTSSSSPSPLAARCDISPAGAEAKPRAKTSGVTKSYVPRRPAPHRPKTPPMRDVEDYIMKQARSGGSATVAPATSEPDEDETVDGNTGPDGGKHV